MFDLEKVTVTLTFDLMASMYRCLHHVIYYLQTKFEHISIKVTKVIAAHRKSTSLTLERSW